MEVYAMEDYPTRLADASEENDVHKKDGVKLALGHETAALVTSDGEVYAWGGKTWLEPHRMTALSGKYVQEIACGNKFYAAVAENGELYTWSRSGIMGRSPALGHNSKKAVAQPTLVEDLAGGAVSRVSCGKSHMMALLE